MNSIIINTDIHCTVDDLPKLRKSVISQFVDVFGKQDGTHRLFHNHDEKGVIERYPRIQYRSHYRKLIIFGWGEAVELLKSMILMADPDEHLLHINNVGLKQQKNSFTKSDLYQYYRIKDWVFMNNEQYNRWKDSFSMVERLQIMNDAITRHLRILATLFIEAEDTEKIKGELFMIERIKSQIAYENKVIGANVIFKTKYDIPENFALGRNVSLGVGTYQKLKTNPEVNSTIKRKIVR